MNSRILISPTYAWGFKPILSGKFARIWLNGRGKQGSRERLNSFEFVLILNYYIVKT